MNKEQAEERLKKDFEWYEAKVDQVARRIFVEHVKPFCRKRKWRFLTGMGAWAFYPPNTRALGRDDVILDDPEWDEMRELLGIEVHGYSEGDLGSIMPMCRDYSYEDERDQLVADAAEGDPGEENERECVRRCAECDGWIHRMGQLGNKIHFRCKSCGAEFSRDAT